MDIKNNKEKNKKNKDINILVTFFKSYNKNNLNRFKF